MSHPVITKRDKIRFFIEYYKWCVKYRVPKELFKISEFKKTMQAHIDLSEFESEYTFKEITGICRTEMLRILLLKFILILKVLREKKANE